MATTFRITTWTPSELRHDSVIDAAFQEIARLNTLFSDYEPRSEISRLSRSGTEGMRVSDDLWRLLLAAHAISEKTDGAFDFTCGHLSHLWRRAIRRGELPPHDRLEKGRELTDWTQIDFDESTKTVRLLQPEMLLDLGGIAKGYAADAALATLREGGIPHALVTAGGDLAIGDPPPGESGWEVHLRTFEDITPDAQLRTANSGVSTSGDLHQFVEIDGVRYSHIVSPQTGLGLSDRISCSVVAPNAMTSDAMATAFCVAGVERLKDWPQRMPGVEARIVRLIDGTPQESRSPGFPTLQ